MARLPGLALAALLAILPAGPAGAATGAGAPSAGLTASPARAVVPGEVVVRMRPRVAAAAERRTLDRADVTVARDLPISRVSLLRADRGQTVPEAVARLARDPNVEWAEPNYVVRTAQVTDDPFLSEQYALHNVGQRVGGLVTAAPDADVDAPEAWDVTTGSPDVLVAVVDSGIDLNNPDLAPNLATNPGETGAGREANGIDDDRNGLVDDWRGWDFVDDDNDPTDLALFPHGTVAASVIGARGGDGFGVAGVAHRARILPLRTHDIEGSGTTADIAVAFAYAARMGARIVNGSFGGPGFSRAQSAAIAEAEHTLFVFSAGNDAADNDSVAIQPCNDPAPNVVCVAATDERDALADFSNFGATQVDLAAPGVGILADAPAYDTIVADGFETALDGRWTTGGTKDSWARTDERAASGSFSLADSPGGPYAENTDSFAETVAPFSLAGRVGCRLDLQLLLASERIGNSFVDGLVVEASADGATWTTLARFSGSSGGTFVGVDADLTELQGQSAVRLRLRFVSDFSVNDDGAHVDDLAVRCLGSTYTGREVLYANGTSFSAPIVSGIAALLLSVAPDLDVPQLKAALLAGVDPLPALAGRMVTGGRANAARALAALPPGAATDPPTAIGRTDATFAATVRPRGQATSVRFDFGTTPAYGSSTPAAPAGDAIAPQPVAQAVQGLAPGTTYHYRVVATSHGVSVAGGDQVLRTLPASVPAVVGAPATSPPPALTGLRAARSGRRVELQARSSADAALFALVVRNGVVVREVTGVRFAAGSVRVPLGRPAAGRYQVLALALGTAGGRSAVVSTRFTVPRPTPRRRPR